MTYTNEQVKAQSDAMLKAVEEFKVCKRSPKTGLVMENSRHAVKKRLVKALEASGVSYDAAWDMAHELGDIYAK